MALAVSRKGWRFTLRSAMALAAVAVFSLLHPVAVQVGAPRPGVRRARRAGYVQLGLDTAVVVAFLAVGDTTQVLLAAAGAVVLNLVLAMNHRPGRYLA